MEEKDIVGEFQVLRPDERVSEGTLTRKSFFDLTNPGDEVVFRPTAPTPPEQAVAQAETEVAQAPAGAAGLLRRVYRLLGLASAGLPAGGARPLD
jgi:hypothetical protein